MNLSPDAAELKAIWQKGRPVLPLSGEVASKVLDGLNLERHWVARLNAARLASVVEWSEAERTIVVDRLLALRGDPNRFVRPWALGSVWQMVEVEDSRREMVDRWMADALASGSAAERARARYLLK